MIALSGLFLAAFLAATLIPAQSEAVLVALLVAGDLPIWLLLSVATAGNVLGAAVNWALGRWLARDTGAAWLPVSPGALDQARRWYARWGRWSLLGAWLPVVGDALTLAAGVLREPFWRFAAIVSLAKGGRYVAVAAVTLAWV